MSQKVAVIDGLSGYHTGFFTESFSALKLMWFIRYS